MADVATAPLPPPQVAPDDNGIRNDFLAGRGAARQAQIQRQWDAIGTPDAKPQAPPEPQTPMVSVPIGKRIMTVAHGFLNALGGDIGDLATGLVNVAKIPGEVYQHGEVGSPELESQARNFASIFGIRPVPGGIRMGMPMRGAAAADSSVGTPGIPETLGERVKAKLAEGAEPKPEGGAEKPAEPAKPAEPVEPAKPQRDVLQLGDPLEPAVTIRSTPQTAAMADVTLGRMDTLEEAPAEGETRPAGRPAPEARMEAPAAAAPIPGQPPIARFRQDAAKIEEGLPAPGEGTTRLWRGNRPGEIGSATTFTNDLPGIALPFREPYGGDISYVDVPTADLTKYENKAGAAPGAEFSLPPEFAQQAKATGWAQPVPPEPSMLSSEAIHDYLAGARVDNPVKVNLARIGSGDDIADVLAQVSKTIPANAVQSHEATIFAADALGLSPENFLANYKGTSLSPEEITAMRFVVDSSASQLIDYAKAARAPMASPEANAEWLKAFTVHRSLQQYMENARNESGRGLNAWKIMSQQRANYTQALHNLLRNVDASGDLSNLAEQVADLDNPLQVNRLVAQSMQGTGRDTLMSLMYNIRLSSPTTITKKMMSDVSMVAWNIATRYHAETFGSGAVHPGETGALAYGYLSALPDALRAGGKALRAGESQYYKDYGTMDSFDASAGYRAGDPAMQAQRVNQRFRMSALANGMAEPLEVGQPTRSMLSFLQAAKPTSWIAGADDFAKVWHDRANMRALAWRAADGDTTQFNQLLDTPPQWLRQQAMSEALKYSFQEPLTGVAESLRSFADGLNIRIPKTQMDIPWGRMILPFVKVPANLNRMAYRSSPLAYIFPSESVRNVLATAGPERDILQAQIGIGTAYVMGIMGLAVNGNITGKGPTNPALQREFRAAGNQPYSIQPPGARPIGINAMEPMGMINAATADTVNLMKFAKDEDNDKLVLSLVFGVGQALLSRTYFQGASDFLDTLAHPDEDSGRYTSRLIASFVPAGIEHIASATDQWQRAHYGIMDAIEANLPIVREGLPPMRTLWGDPVPTREAYLPFMSGHLASIVSPIPLGPEPESVEPIDKWIFDNRAAFPREEQTQRGISKPSKTQNFKAGPNIEVPVELDPVEYDRLQALAGNELPDPANGLGAKDALNSFVNGTHPEAAKQREWDNASPAGKALIVNTTVDRYRKAAKEQLLQDFPDIEAAVRAGAETRAQQLTGGATR